MMQVMMYSLPAYLEPMPQIDGDLTPDIDHLLKLASFTITIPVIVFSAWPFFRSALRDVRNRHVGMDVPVTAGIIVTFSASIWATFRGGPVYFDSLIMFVFFLLSARWIQTRVHNISTSALRVLTKLIPQIADKLPGFPTEMIVEKVNASQLAVGDYILIQPGTKIPVDGEVISGSSECDESLMTGESLAVSKSPSDILIGGSMNLSRALVMKTSHVGNDTQLSSLVRKMESAANEKPPLVLLADRYASIFLTVIFALALLTGIIWWEIDSTRAIWIAVTVLVITCPCALSLATPGVMSAAIGQLAKHGVLIARGRAIESLANATHFVFDKTGTLTQGRLKLVAMNIMRTDSSIDEECVRQVTKNVTAGSMHPVAHAIFSSLSARSHSNVAIPFDETNEIPGRGIEIHHHETVYRLGSIEFVKELNGVKPEIPPDFSEKTISVLGDKNGYIALFALEDTLRNDAKYLVDFLQQSGKTVLLLSGDRQSVVSITAKELGIIYAMGSLSPEAKYEVVKSLQHEGAVVAMVGDGMNDGPVLSIADVSIAMGQGAPISQARSDMVLISNDLKDISYAVKTTMKSFSLIRQNLGWAVLYNAIAIPAAMAGILAPWHAAIGMSLSSIIVVVNSLRVYTIHNSTKS